MKSKPIIGITMGDPAGNGPELSVKALLNEAIYEDCHPIIIGDSDIIKEDLDILNVDLTVHSVKKIEDAKFKPGIIDVLDMGILSREDREFGKVQKNCGDAAFQYVVKVIELALSGKVDATVTNAINKEAINLAGHKYSGHTEIYAHYSNTNKYTMMLAHDNMRVVHVSTHVSLREACDAVTKQRVLDVIKIANQGLKDLGITNPKIAVAGLNPHAGENGMFGREEIEEIQPAIDLALDLGINIPDKAPVPADTVFSKMDGGWYDIVIAMYHDQGHIPIKLKGFTYNRDLDKWDAVSGVNITLGLPIIRVSVDHGTGFDQAGKGTASPDSLLSAIKYATLYAKNR